MFIKFNKENRGIALVVVMITIIVLLILAGITINLITGNGEILGRAESAVQKHKESSSLENTTSKEQIVLDKNQYNNLLSRIESLENQDTEEITELLERVEDLLKKSLLLRLM